MFAAARKIRSAILASARMAGSSRVMVQGGPTFHNSNKRKHMLIVYTNCGDEVIVTTLENEHKMLFEFFTEGDRDLDDYDREEVKDVAVNITPAISVG